MKQKKSYIFIMINNDDEISVGRQTDVDDAIKNSEFDEDGIDFEVIGKIQEPSPTIPLPVDFDETKIEWYDKKQRSSEFTKRAITAIKNFIN